MTTPQSPTVLSAGRDSDLVIITGNSNRKLAQAISDELKKPLAVAKVDRFANGEINIKIEDNIRGEDVFILQPTCTSDDGKCDVNSSVMELLLLIHTLRLASAKRITAVIPHYAYARQDRKSQPRVPISASAVASLLTSMGVDRVLTCDLHCGQIQGFFHNIPVDNLYCFSLFAAHYQETLKEQATSCTVVAPDAGAVPRARKFADTLGAQNLVTILKRRVKANEVEEMQIVGGVEGQVCIIIDDMSDTSGTLVKAVEHLKEKGAKKVYACITHGIFSHPAMDRLNKCDALEEIVCTDSIDQTSKVGQCKKLKVLSIGPMLARAISHIHSEKSLSALFQSDGGHT
eukprot:TRINITY_DN86386_c0_g1_i1.p1 TRINITY_DN86386_c0_g1~~TRINITY_DN86386_c0_g1_i1.p1  ORF type:complete len:345 (-),score=57.82 TRINITY_DN86386_c0_g1_i1:90-1124(-)